MPAIELKFTEVPARGRKTGQWSVSNPSGTHLGRVTWWTQWRTYVFVPALDTVFDATCLERIRSFVLDQNSEHLAQLRKKKQPLP
jgi:hypothetical protein